MVKHMDGEKGSPSTGKPVWIGLLLENLATGNVNPSFIAMKCTSCWIYILITVNLEMAPLHLLSTNNRFQGKGHNSWWATIHQRFYVPSSVFLEENCHKDLNSESQDMQDRKHLVICKIAYGSSSQNINKHDSQLIWILPLDLFPP